MADSTSPAVDRSDTNMFDSVSNSLRLTSPVEAMERLPRRLSDTDRPRYEKTNLPFRLHPASLLGGSDSVDHLVDQSLPNLRDQEQHKCKAQHCAVAKVFQTTELQEFIFSFLEYRDILALRRVNRQCNSVVQGSSKLRLQFFFLRGQFRRPGESFELLPLNLPGLSVQRGDELDRGQWIEVHLTMEAARRICPRARTSSRVRARSIFEGLRGGLGSRRKDDKWPAKNTTPDPDTELEYEDLLISQPPILGVQAFVEERHRLINISAGDEPDDGFRLCAKLSCETGITLGFLAETALSIIHQDRGSSNQSDSKILFKAIMSFSDPEKEPRKERSSKTTVFYL